MRVKAGAEEELGREETGAGGSMQNSTNIVAIIYRAHFVQVYGR